MSNTYEQLNKPDSTVQDAGLFQGQVRHSIVVLNASVPFLGSLGLSHSLTCKFIHWLVCVAEASPFPAVPCIAASDAE